MKKSKLILVLSGCALILGGYVLYNTTHPVSLYSEINLSTEESRRDFLRTCGLSISEMPPDTAEITLPSDDNSIIYAQYCQLQEKQSLGVKNHFGKPAFAYTYTLTDPETARAELVCTEEGVLIGAMYYDRTSFQNMYPLID